MGAGVGINRLTSETAGVSMVRELVGTPAQERGNRRRRTSWILYQRFAVNCFDGAEIICSRRDVVELRGHVVLAFDRRQS